MKCSVEKCKKTAKVRGYCRPHYRLMWRHENPNKVKKYEATDAVTNRAARTEKQRESRLRVLFNLTGEDYAKILEFQKSHDVYRLLLGPNKKIRDAVEHRHNDGLIRGVMRGMLNRFYGCIERLYPNNTAEIFRALAFFHENHPATLALGEPVYGLIGEARHKKVMKYGPLGTPKPHPRRRS